MWDHVLYDSTSSSDFPLSVSTGSDVEREFECSSRSSSESVGNCASLGSSVNFVRKFGDFEDTYNWIECESRSFPGRFYYFNLRSLCSTWVRPIPTEIQLSRFYPKSRTHNESSYDSEEPPMMVSENEEEDDHFSEDQMLSLPFRNGRRNKLANKRLQLLMRLYYNIYTDRSVGNEDYDFNDNYFCDFEENDFYGEKTEGKLIEPISCNGEKDISFSDDEIQDKSLFPDKNSKENLYLQCVPTDFLAMEFSVSEEKCINGILNEIDAPFVQNSADNYGTFTDTDDNREVTTTYYAPRLHRHFTDKDFQQTPLKKRRRVRKKLDVKPKKPNKIICNMYGTTTVNYDPIEPELPSGVKVMNLSDSSDESSVREQNNVKTNLLEKFDFSDVGIKVLKLSSSSSSNSTSSSSFSSSSCSTCSCSSCCSSSSSSSCSSNSNSNTSSRTNTNSRSSSSSWTNSTNISNTSSNTS